MQKGTALVVPIECSVVGVCRPMTQANTALTSFLQNSHDCLRYGSATDPVVGNDDDCIVAGYRSHYAIRWVRVESGRYRACRRRAHPQHHQVARRDGSFEVVLEGPAKLVEALVLGSFLIDEDVPLALGSFVRFSGAEFGEVS